MLVSGKAITATTDKVKPAYVFNEAYFRNTVCNPAAKATPATSSPPPAIRTKRSGRHVHFPERFNT
jgi:hypothetical protein